VLVCISVTDNFGVSDDSSTAFVGFRCSSTMKHNQTSHASVNAVRTTFKVYGKKQTLTLSQPKTPEPIVTKFKRRDYVVDAYHQKNFG